MEFPSVEWQRLRLTILLTAIAVSGCATTDPVCDQDCDSHYDPVSYRKSSLPDRDPEKIHRKQFYLFPGYPTTVTLNDRVSEREWAAIDKKKVFVGMSELAATYSLGVPSRDILGPLGILYWHGAPVIGNVWQDEGHWGLRRIYKYDCWGNTPDRTCAPAEAWQDMGVFNTKSREIWVFVENGVVVNFNHGRFQEIYDHDDGEISWWSGWEHIMWDYQRLPNPPDDVFYAMSQNADSAQDGLN